MDSIKTLENRWNWFIWKTSWNEGR